MSEEISEFDGDFSQSEPSSSKSPSDRDRVTLHDSGPKPFPHQPVKDIYNNEGNEPTGLDEGNIWLSNKNSFNKAKLQQTDNDTESITNSSDDDQQASKSFCDEQYNFQLVSETVNRKSENDMCDNGYGFYIDDNDDENDEDIFELVNNTSMHDSRDYQDHNQSNFKATSPLSILFNAEEICINQSSTVGKTCASVGMEHDKLDDFISILEAKSQLNSGHRMLFNYVNEKSSIICKSFSRISRSNSSVESQEYDRVTASIQGFRIVQTTLGSHHAEFIISVDINNHNFKIWKRYSEFKAFADILFGEMEDPSCIEDREEPMYKAWESWQDIMNNKSWFRDLGILYLIKKTLKLEQFLRFAVWGMDTHEPFFQFLIDDSVS